MVYISLKPTVVVVGTIHMDYTVYVDRLPTPGETVIGYTLESSPGGKGANQAVMLSRLGAKVYMVSRVGGNSIGLKLIEKLRSEGVNTSYVTVDNSVKTGVAFITVDSKGENMIVVYSGADSKISVEDVLKAQNIFKSGRILLTQLEIPLETAIKALKLASKKNMITILNPAPARTLPREVYEDITILTPNIRELEKLAEMKVKSLDDVKKACKKLRDEGVRIVIVTLGGRGAAIFDDKGFRIIPAFKVKVVDTVAAGDAFNAALAYAIGVNVDVDEAVKFANLVAAVKVTKRGAFKGLPTLSEILEYARRFNIKFSFLGEC